MVKVIDDLVILGRAAPDSMRDGRHSLCSAGYSPTIGFVRLFPTYIDTPLHRWDEVTVRVEDESGDYRLQSHKLVYSNNPAKLNENISLNRILKRSEKIKFIESLPISSIDDLGTKDKTIGLIKPHIIGVDVVPRECEDGKQLTIFGSETIKTKSDYDFMPRLKYYCTPKCGQCPHNQQLLEHGAYEFMRKNKGNEQDVLENLRILDRNFDKWFLVGNMKHHPARFVVISVLRFKSSGSC